MCIFPDGVCSLFETVSHLAGPAVSYSGSLIWPSQCWVPDVQHMRVSKPVLYFTLPSDIVNTDNDFDF